MISNARRISLTIAVVSVFVALGCEATRSDDDKGERPPVKDEQLKDDYRLVDYELPNWEDYYRKDHTVYSLETRTKIKLLYVPYENATTIPDNPFDANDSASPYQFIKFKSYISPNISAHRLDAFGRWQLEEWLATEGNIEDADKLLDVWRRLTDSLYHRVASKSLLFGATVVDVSRYDYFKEHFLPYKANVDNLPNEVV